MSNNEFIAELKARVSVSEILGRFVQLKPSGALRFKGCCPFHNEKTPSFVVSDDRECYHCFGCGAHGDIFSFLTDKEGYEFKDAVEFVAQIGGITVPKFSQKTDVQVKEIEGDLDIINSFNEFFKTSLEQSNIAKTYIKGRKINSAIVKKFEIGYAPDKQEINEFIQRNSYSEKKLLELGLFKEGSYGSYFLFAERLIFPIHNHKNKVVAFGGRILKEGNPKYINSPEYKFFKKREILYNFNRAKLEIQKNKKAIICEGYMDVVAMSKAGFTNVVAPMGTSFSIEHLEFLWRFVDVPTICLDGDEAGKRAMQRIANMAIPLLSAGKSLQFLILPEGDDPDDLLQKTDGKRKLEHLLKNQISIAKVILTSFLGRINKDKISPEDKAKVKQELQNISKQIIDKSVASEYYQYFMDEFFAFFRKDFMKKNLKKTSLRPLEKIRISSAELEIILFILEDSTILKNETIDEDFSMLEFNTEELSIVREVILEFYNENIVNKEPILKALEKKISLAIFNLLKNKIIISVEENKKDIMWEYLKENLTLENLKENYSLLIREESEQKIIDSAKKELLSQSIKIRNLLEEL